MMASRAAVAVLVVAGILGIAPMRASAAAGFDSRYAGESAFLSVAPGGTGTFSVFFANTGSVVWVAGTVTQVDLAVCLADQTTCNVVDPGRAAFDPGTWRAPGRYATQMRSTVAPGGIATFSYSVRVPASVPPGTYRFNGDLVVAVTGELIHPEGYYHALTVAPASCVPATITTVAALSEAQVGRTHDERITARCANGSPAVGVALTATVVTEGQVAGNPDLRLTATTDATGLATVSWTRSNPGTDFAYFFVTGAPAVSAQTYTRWTVADRVLSCTPSDDASLAANSSRLFEIRAKDPNTGAPLANASLSVTVVEYISSGTARINGVDALAKLAGTTVATVVTDAAGVAGIDVFGKAAVIRPRIFIDEDRSGALGAREFRADCGATTFGP